MPCGSHLCPLTALGCAPAQRENWREKPQGAAWLDPASTNSNPASLPLRSSPFLSLFLGKQGKKLEQNGDMLYTATDLFRVLLIQYHSQVSWLLWIFIKGNKQVWDLGLS